MSFADELRKKADSAPKEEQSAENRYMNEIYFSLKEGIVRCFLKKCYEEASRGGTSYSLYVDFIHIIGIIHEQERAFVKESDFDYVKHVLKINKDDLRAFILKEMKKNELKNIKVNVKASRLRGYSIKISVSW